MVIEEKHRLKDISLIEYLDIKLKKLLAINNISPVFLTETNKKELLLIKRAIIDYILKALVNTYSLPNHKMAKKLKYFYNKLISYKGEEAVQEMLRDEIENQFIELFERKVKKEDRLVFNIINNTIYNASRTLENEYLSITQAEDNEQNKLDKGESDKDRLVAFLTELSQEKRFKVSAPESVYKNVKDYTEGKDALTEETEHFIKAYFA